MILNEEFEAHVYPPILEMSKQADRIWIPKWASLFSDPSGGFYERLSDKGVPLKMRKRLLSQCRMIIILSRAYREKAYTDIGSLRNAFEFTLEHYKTPQKGGFIFSLTQDNDPDDTHYDLYAHAFVVLMCAEYYEATNDERALQIANDVVQFIKSAFEHETGLGFYEALDQDLKPMDKIRRQNPHMHLLEACLAIVEIQKDPVCVDLAQTLMGLFYQHFYERINLA